MLGIENVNTQFKFPPKEKLGLDALEPCMWAQSKRRLCPGGRPMSTPSTSPTVSLFGTCSIGDVHEIVLKNELGTRIHLLDYGATLRCVWLRNRKGDEVDVVLGYDAIQDYLKDECYLGCTVGRVANRIAYGKFTLNGKNYQLNPNDPPHHSHGGGGSGAFSKKIWNCEILPDNGGVRFSLTSPNGDAGYPGQLTAYVSYRLTDQNVLTIDFKAETDASTIVNLVNHSYWNLDGEGSTDLANHLLHLNIDGYFENDETNLSTGLIQPIKNTRFDFGTPKLIMDAEKVNNKLGMDNDFGYMEDCIISATSGRNFAKRKMLRLSSLLSGIALEVHSTYPALHLYSADQFDCLIGKNGHEYPKCCALAIEPQMHSNAVNYWQLPTVILNPGQVYHHHSSYHFFSEPLIDK